MAWLPDSVKVMKIRLFVLTEFTNVKDGQTRTHRQIPHDDVGRACIAIASRGKKRYKFQTAKMHGFLVFQTILWRICAAIKCVKVK